MTECRNSGGSSVACFAAHHRNTALGDLGTLTATRASASLIACCEWMGGQGVAEDRSARPSRFLSIPYTSPTHPRPPAMTTDNRWILFAFEMTCSGHQSPGLWTHRQDKSHLYNKMSYWTDLAKLLEKGEQRQSALLTLKLLTAFLPRTSNQASSTASSKRMSWASTTATALDLRPPSPLAPRYRSSTPRSPSLRWPPSRAI